MAKKLANILRPLVGHSLPPIRNPKHFVDLATSIRLGEGECIASYDVEAVFTSLSVDPAISIFKHKLLQDAKLHNRTSMPIPHITTLLEFCLKDTHFLFLDKYYEQVYGAAMGSLISPIVANLFKEKFETRANNTAPSTKVMA